MPTPARSKQRRSGGCRLPPRRILIALLRGLPLLLSAIPLRAAIVTGKVTDSLGAGIVHATVALVQNGRVVADVLTQNDGTYRLTTGTGGRFYVIVSAQGFRQTEAHSFYAEPVGLHQEDVVMEGEQARRNLVVTPTGTPTPQAEASAQTSVVRSGEFASRIDLIDSLRQAPGVFMVQQGQYGGPATLFIRGGNSDSNRIVLDGNPVEDIGGTFDFANVATLGVGQFELYRGPNSVLYGSDAASGVLSLSTPRGSTAFPSLFYEGDGGVFGSFRNQLQLGGTHNRLDYYGGFSAFQSANDLPLDEYHDDTGAANLGVAITAATQLRVSARNSDSGTGAPGAFDFYGIANAGKQSDQGTYLSASIENQRQIWHSVLLHGMTRKRQEDQAFYPAGIPISTKVNGVVATNYYGFNTVIAGANGYSVTGQALLNFAGTYPNRSELVNNRDQLYFQSDWRLPYHTAALFAFHFEDERGAEKDPAYAIDETLERANYDYTAQFHGEVRRRVFYSLGGGVEKNQLFGTVGTPQLGLAYYPVRPGDGLMHGTKITFSFAKGYQEPSLGDQFGSLYGFLLRQPGGAAAIARFGVHPIGAEFARTYEGGVEQSIWGQRILFRAVYFHNEYENQIEPVAPAEAPLLLPNLSPGARSSLESLLANGPGIDLNSQAFRAQGLESEFEYSVMSNLFLRGGYTYLDAVVQRSFTSDALHPSFNTGYPGLPPPSFASIPIGAFDPLRGARPFRRPPHTAFATVTYTGGQYAVEFNASFASRSDDSTFLAGDDLKGGNSLLLPNRNLDYSYAKLDLGGSYQLFSWLAIYAQATNLTNNGKIGPIGYPSLPFAYRAGLRLSLGHLAR